MKVNGQLHVMVALPLGKQVPLLIGDYMGDQGSVEEKNLSSLPEIDLWTIHPVVQSVCHLHYSCSLYVWSIRSSSNSFF